MHRPKDIAILLGTTFLVFIIENILLAIRLEYYINISYFIVSIPSFILVIWITIYSAACIVEYFRLPVWDAFARADLYVAILLLILAQSFGWTHFLMALRFDNIIYSNFVILNTPLYAGLGLVIILFIGALADEPEIFWWNRKTNLNAISKSKSNEEGLMYEFHKIN